MERLTRRDFLKASPALLAALATACGTVAEPPVPTENPTRTSTTMPTPTEIPTSTPETPTPTPEIERVEGEWTMEVEGSHGTIIRLAIDRQVREREEVSLHELRFVDTNTLEAYYGSQEGFVEASLQAYGSDGLTREAAEEFATLLWQAFPEGKAIDSLEAAFLRAVFERGREVGLFSGLSFEGYILAVEEAHRSGNSSGVSVPLTEGRIIDPIRPVTFAFIDPDVLEEENRRPRRIGSSTEEWVDYVYFLRGPWFGLEFHGEDPMGWWERHRWQIGFDNGGGVVFAYILDEQFLQAPFYWAKRYNDPAMLGFLLAGSIEDMLLSIQRNEFLNTSRIPGASVTDLGSCRGFDFIQDSLQTTLWIKEDGSRAMFPTLFPVNSDFQY